MKTLKKILLESFGEPQYKSYFDRRFSTSIRVKVTFPGEEPFIDDIKGLNKGHAMSLARDNWEGANIQYLGPTTEDENDYKTF